VCPDNEPGTGCSPKGRFTAQATYSAFWESFSLESGNHESPIVRKSSRWTVFNFLFRQISLREEFWIPGNKGMLIKVYDCPGQSETIQDSAQLLELLKREIDSN